MIKTLIYEKNINMKKTSKRRFTGKLSGFENNKEANFSKKELKAYLRGWERFSYGKDKDGQPIFHKTPVSAV